MSLKSLFTPTFEMGSEEEKRYYERLKIAFLTVAFFCVIGSYTVAKELKNSVFVYVVGLEYIPIMRSLSLIFFVPAILLYTRLVDRIRRYHLLCLYSSFFGFMGLVFAYYLGHPTIGLANTDVSKFRLFGWLFYFFIEGYSPFVVAVFWAYTNSVCSPKSAKDHYGWIVSGSKLGGMLAAGLAWIFLGMRDGATLALATDVHNHQVLMAGASFLLLLAPIIVIVMIRNIPGSFLHGYEAAYQVEKHKKEQHKADTGIFGGLKLLVKYPYVMGIFGMIYFYEVISTVLSYIKIGVAQSNDATMSEALRYLLEVTFVTQCVGLLISIIGTNVLFRILGTRRCLLLIPISAGLVLLYFVLSGSNETAVLVASVALQAVNYAFSGPLRESLYIPTIKDIKFKSKSWVDAFGSKFAKTSGSAFNIAVQGMGAAGMAYSVLFSGLVALWLGTAYLLGRRFDDAVAKNEVIGAESGD